MKRILKDYAKAIRPTLVDIKLMHVNRELEFLKDSEDWNYEFDYDEAVLLEGLKKYYLALKDYYEQDLKAEKEYKGE